MAEVGTKWLIDGLIKQTQILRELYRSVVAKRDLSRTQRFQFLHQCLFQSSPVVMKCRWRLTEYCQKNKWQRWDISEEFSMWHFVTKSTGLKSVKSGMSSHFSESRDPSYVSSAMCSEYPRKDWRSKSFGLQSTPTRKRLRGRRRTGGVTTFPTLLGPVFMWSQQNYLRFLLIATYFGPSCGWRPRVSPERKSGHENEKMNECEAQRWTFLFMKLSFLICQKWMSYSNN